MIFWPLQAPHTHCAYIHAGKLFMYIKINLKKCKKPKSIVELTIQKNSKDEGITVLDFKIDYKG